MAEMPIHPITGLSAIGFTRRGPIWPVMGGAPEGGDGGGNGNDGGDGDGSGSGNDGGGKTFTQAELNSMIESRLAQERNSVTKKYGNLDELATAAGKLKQIEEASQSDLEKLQNQLTEFRTQAEQAQAGKTQSDIALLKFEVASSLEGFPIASATRLQGSTKEEIEADAKKFLDDLGVSGGGPRPPKPNRQQGNSSGNDGDKSVSAGAQLYQQRHKTQ